MTRDLDGVWNSKDLRLNEQTRTTTKEQQLNKTQFFLLFPFLKCFSTFGPFIIIIIFLFIDKNDHLLLSVHFYIFLWRFWILLFSFMALFFFPLSYNGKTTTEDRKCQLSPGEGFVRSAPRLGTTPPFIVGGCTSFHKCAACSATTPLTSFLLKKK